GGTAGDDADDQLRGRPEGRGTFAGVEHAEAPGGPRADVDEASAPLEGRYGELDRAGDRFAFPVHGRRHRGVFAVDEIHDLERRGDVDALGSGITVLGETGIEILGRGHEGCRVAPKLDVDRGSGQRTQYEACACRSSSPSPCSAPVRAPPSRRRTPRPRRRAPRRLPRPLRASRPLQAPPPIAPRAARSSRATGRSPGARSRSPAATRWSCPDIRSRATSAWRS